MPEDYPEKPSKTQRKKEMVALQEIGETLVHLPDSQLGDIPMPDQLHEAIRHFRLLKNNEARRRQLQYIGKIMREVDPEPILAALKKLQLSKEKNTAQFHQIEQWREQLITEGDSALQRLLEVYPQADRQQLRQLIRKAQQDRANNKNSGAETALFKYLREM